MILKTLETVHGAIHYPKVDKNVFVLLFFINIGSIFASDGKKNIVICFH